MIPDHLLAHYDRIADAPDAVARLQHLVLKLAATGRLVPQNPEDLTATEALTEARRWLRDKSREVGRLRWKPTNSAVELPLGRSLPHGWVLASINDTGFYVNGLAFKPADWKPSGQPIIRIQNLTNPTKEFNFARGQFPDEVVVRDGDLLVSWSATLDAFRWNRGAGVLNQHIFRVIPAPGLTSVEFLLLLLRNAIRELAESEHAHGLVMTHINRGPFLAHAVMVPPLTEQHRIVAKVDELMALCDQLEAARSKRETLRDRLTTASFACLNSPDPATVRSDAHFALDALPALTARCNQVRQLRQTILNSAVRGLLSKRIASDQSASTLLARIERERPKGLPEVPEIPKDYQYEVAPEWAWSTLGHLIVSGPQNGVSPKPSKREDAPRAITLTATTSGSFDSAHFKRVEASAHVAEKYWLRNGDLLFQRGNTRDLVGMAAIYSGPHKAFLYPDLMIRVRISPRVNLRYIHLAALAPPARCYFSEKATGAQETMPKINQSTLLSLPVALPPRLEQDRIVAKVDELMALCTQLETILLKGDEARGRLLEALIHEALEPRRGEAA